MRQHICKACGKIFLANKMDSTYCQPCLHELKSASVLRERICQDCGQIFMGYPKSKRCKDCQLAARRRADAKRHRTGTKRPIGSTDTCVACGKKYTVNSGMQRYCPECSKIVVNENIKAHKRDYAQKHKEKQVQQKAARRKDRKICAICGKPFTSNRPSVTCSPACAAKHKQQSQARADVKRGKAAPQRLLAPRGPVHPQSGVPGIHWHKSGKWEVVVRKKYIGLFDTVDAAKAAKEAAEISK